MVNGHNEGGIDRRRFLRRSGMAAGGLLALGAGTASASAQLAHDSAYNHGYVKVNYSLVPVYEDATEDGDGECQGTNEITQVSTGACGYAPGYYMECSGTQYNPLVFVDLLDGDGGYVRDAYLSDVDQSDCI